MKLIRRSSTETYYYNNDSIESTLKETVIEYCYNNETEKKIHKEKMEAAGFHDSGQEKNNTGTINEPEYVWYGRYWKSDRVMEGE